MPNGEKDHRLDGEPVHAEKSPSLSGGSLYDIIYLSHGANFEALIYNK